MKVAILSMQRIINYGSVLQAYALKRIIENFDKEVEFIDIEDGIYHEKNEKKSDPKKNNISLEKIKFGLKNKLIEREILNFQKKELKLGKYNTTPSLGCGKVVIGSDEVFNCNPKSSWGISLQLYGKIESCNAITYAASCGYFDEKSIPKEYKKQISDSLKNLDRISVRDQNTFDFVKKLTGIEPFIHLDPVLIYDFEKELKEKKNQVKLKKKYMIVYAYRDRINDENEIKQIKDYAKQKNLEIYCIGGIQKWCKHTPNWTPFQVLNAFKNAECIVTDTFHGCIMSIKYNKKFAVLVRDSNKNKINDLVRKLKLEEQVLNKNKQIRNILSKHPNYDFYNNIIFDEIKKTHNYLENNIK